ncbi:unnamed protein product, partial [Ceratitis capitata]
MEPTTTQLSARQCIPQQSPMFSFGPEEWPIFISTFRNSIAVDGTNIATRYITNSPPTSCHQHPGHCRHIHKETPDFDDFKQLHTRTESLIEAIEQHILMEIRTDTVNK